MLTKDSPTKRTYESHQMFSTKKGSIDYVYEWFRKYHVIRDERKLKELVHKAFSSGLFKLEKETFYHLKVDLRNRKKFYDSLISKYKILDNLQTNDFTYVSKGLENNSATHTIDYDTENIIEVELNKLETFEQLFFNLFLKVRQEIGEAIFLYYSSTPPTEEYKLRYGKAKGLLNELLDIFYEMVNVYTKYSTTRWSKAIQNKELEKLFSAVFSKIAKMRISLSDAIASFRSHDFTSLTEQYISRNIYASEKLMNHIATFNDSDVGKDSEPLLDCLWKIYEACYEYAFPEPSLYQWDFKYNEGYKKFVELQNEHPDQTYSNFIKSYSKD
jgi:predicted adenine nucleotide alpha hydrolase (AANH) superfamily ATPase